MGQTVVLAGRLGTEVEEIYRRFAPAIHRRCRALLASDEEALDAVHDIFLRLHEKLDTFRGDSELMTWLYRLSTNHCLNRLRDARTHARLLGGLSAPDSTGDLSVELERRDLLGRLLDAFDDEDVQLAVHYYYDEMTQQEIARVLGISERTVRTRLRELERRARERVIALEAMGAEARG